MLTEAKKRQVEEHQTRIAELESMVEDKNRQLQAYAQPSQFTIQSKDQQLQMKDRQLQECHQRAIEMKERELQQTQGQLRASEQIVLQSFSRACSRKTRPSLTSSRPYQHKRKIQQLRHNQ